MIGGKIELAVFIAEGIRYWLLKNLILLPQHLLVSVVKLLGSRIDREKVSPTPYETKCDMTNKLSYKVSDFHGIEVMGP